jgi:chemotaxis receptor (MCP) glutamine deamidase CheD
MGTGIRSSAAEEATMLLEEYTEYPEYYLKPGYLYITQVPTCIITILGSCVSVCLYDTHHRYGGLNHYQLPEPQALEPPSNRFGSHSIRALYATFIEFGSRPEHLQTRVVGGASMSGNAQSRLVADLNVEMAVRVLAELHVPVLSVETGGSKGRKLWYYTDVNRTVISPIANEWDLDKEYFKEDLSLQL